MIKKTTRMKNYLALLLVLAILIAPITIMPQKANAVGSESNLLINGDFEDGTSGWENWGAWDSLTSVEGGAVTTESAIRLGTTETGCAQMVSGIEEGQVYSISGWAKTEDINEVAFLGVECKDADGKNIENGKFVLEFNDTNYTYKALNFITVSGTQKIQVYTYNNATEGKNIYFDDICLKLADDNLILNPGFESGNSYWEEWGPYSIITTDVKSGLAAVELGDDGGLGQSIMAGQGMEFILSGWGKSGTAGDLAWLGIDCIDKDGTKIPGGKFTLQFGDTEFKHKAMEFTAVTGTVQLVVYIYHNPSPTADTKVILDDLLLVHKHGNMVNNPGFEADNYKWDDWGNFSITDDAHSGSKAAKLGDDGGSGQQKISVKPGTYSLSAWAKVNAEGDMAIVGFNMYDEENNRTREVLEFVSTDYEYKEKTITIPDGIVSIEPYIYKNPGPGEAFIDDIKIIPVKDVATPEVPDKPIDFERVKAMWVWDTVDVLSSAANSQELLNFCVDKGINLIYLNVDQGVLTDYPEKVKSLISKANDMGIKTEALNGNMYWVLEENHHFPLESISEVIAYNESAGPNERFVGIHHDNEPYTVPGFWDDTQSFGEQYLDLAVKSMELINNSGSDMTFAVDIPFWYDEHPVIIEYNGVEKPLSFHIIDIADYVTVMDYRDFAEGSNGIIAHGLQEITHAKSLDKQVVLGVETIKFDDDDVDNPELITFAEEGEAIMLEELDKVNTYFESNYGFGGIAIHHYGSYKNLKSEPPIYIFVEKTDVTSYGGGNGTITVTPSAMNVVEFEFTVDSENWQESNIFTGLRAGSYTVKAREKGNELNESYEEAVVINQPSPPYTSTEKPKDITVEPGKITIRNTIIDNGIVSATLNEDSLMQAFKDSDNVIIDISRVNSANEYSVDLPGNWLMSGNANQSIEIVTELGSIKAPLNMINAGDENVSGTVSLKISKADTGSISDELKDAIGDKPVIGINMYVDGVKKEWENPEAPVIIAIPYTPTEEEQMDPEHIVVWFIDSVGNVIAVPSGRYNAETGCVEFETTHFSIYAVSYSKVTFKDLGSVAWAKKAVEVLASKGIINDATVENYYPESYITRAEYIEMLVRTLNLNAEFDSNFDDIKAGTKHYNAVGIAKKLGITAGAGNNLFKPNTAISRQDMMVLTYNALKVSNRLDSSNNTISLGNFNDKGEIASYAVEAVSRLVDERIIVGSNNKVRPRSETTRAVAAAVLYKIYNY